jgi:hypothetical protein
VYFIYVSWKISRVFNTVVSTSVKEKKLTKNYKQKMYATLGIALCLFILPFAATSAATPLYANPIGYYLCRFCAGFVLYTAMMLQISLFDPNKKTQTTKSKSKFSDRKASSNKDSSLELEEG